MINKTSIKTKIGWVSVFEKKGKIFRIKFGKINKNSKSHTLKKFKKNLFKFYKGKISVIKANAEVNGSKIQIKVWNDLKRIKPGYTKTYGEIGKKFNISPRHVGKICGKNKLVLLIPCHRVIRSEKTLGGFSSVGGIGLKKKLLDFEKKFRNIN